MKRVFVMLGLAVVATPTFLRPTVAVAAKPAPKASVKSAKKEVKVGDKAVCVICAVKEGSKKPEPVKAVLKYKGKTYPFCNLEEKAEFISNPSKYAGVAK